MDEELNLGDFLLDPFPVVGHGLGGIIGSTRRHRSAPIIYVVGEPTDYTGRVARAAYSPRRSPSTMEAARGGVANIRNRRGLYSTRNPNSCLDKPSCRYFLPPSAAHFSSMSVVTDLGRSRA